MKVVLDTNCFISSIGKKSHYRKVFDAFLNKRFTLSSEILLEYEEKFSEFWEHEVTHNLLGVILTAENSSLHSVFFKFYLVSGDPDDNKFSDVYLSARADILVTNDKQLLTLGKNEFPPINAMTLQSFMDFLEHQPYG